LWRTETTPSRGKSLSKRYKMIQEVANVYTAEKKQLREDNDEVAIRTMMFARNHDTLNFIRGTSARDIVLTSPPRASTNPPQHPSARTS